MVDFLHFSLACFSILLSAVSKYLLSLDNFMSPEMTRYLEHTVSQVGARAFIQI